VDYILYNYPGLVNPFWKEKDLLQDNISMTLYIGSINSTALLKQDSGSLAVLTTPASSAFQTT